MSEYEWTCAGCGASFKSPGPPPDEEWWTKAYRLADEMRRHLEVMQRAVKIKVMRS
jgi:hypothetical protein